MTQVTSRASILLRARPRQNRKRWRMSPSPLPSVCIIGAGPTGITTAKRMKEFGIPFDCYEASDEVGGNWYYKNPNGMSACYQSLHIDTSKWRLAFEDFPVSADLPDFPHHSELFQYFKDYVEHFGLRESIIFNTSVVAAERDANGLWTDHALRRRSPYLRRPDGLQWSPLGSQYPGLPGRVRRRPHAQPQLQRPVRSDRHARQESRRGRNGELRLGHCFRTGAEIPRREAHRLGAPRRVGVAEISGRRAGRQTDHPALDASGAAPVPESSIPRQEPGNHGGLRTTQAGPPPLRGTSVSQWRVLGTRRVRRHHLQAGDHQTRRKAGSFRRRHRRGRRRGRLRHRLQHQLPLLRRSRTCCRTKTTVSHSSSA